MIHGESAAAESAERFPELDRNATEESCLISRLAVILFKLKLESPIAWVAGDCSIAILLEGFELF